MFNSISFATSKTVSSNVCRACTTDVIIIVFVAYLFNILLPDMLLIWYNI